MTTPIWILAGAACAAFWAALRRGPHADRDWIHVAEEEGLWFDRVVSWPQMSGQVHGVDVTAIKAKGGVAVQIPVDPWFTLRRRTTMIGRNAAEFEIGDGPFDERIQVEGDREFALALLDEETRRQALEVVAGFGASVEYGTMEVTVRTIRHVPELLRPMAELAKRLRRPSSNELPELLAHRALYDPSPGVRKRAFDVLASEFADAPDWLRVARERLGDLEVEYRLDAAAGLLRHGNADDQAQAVEALAEIAETQALETADRQRALLAFADHSPPEKVLPLCWTILMERLDEPWQVRLAALSVLVEAEALEELLGVEPMLSSDRGEPLEGELLARGLGRLGDIRAQPRLLELLKDDAESVRKAAAESLGSLGDLAAVAPLRKLADSGGLLPTSAASAALQAIAKIQSRAGGTQAGEISLVPMEPLEGAVSSADEPEAVEGGEVSLA